MEVIAVSGSHARNLSSCLCEGYCIAGVRVDYRADLREVDK